MKTYVVLIILAGFIIGIILGCAAKDKPVIAADEGIGFNIVVGQNEAGNPVFMRYDVHTGETWSWTPGSTTYWVPLGEAP